MWGRASWKEGSARSFFASGWERMWASISAARGVAGSYRERVASSEGGVTRPVTVGAAGAAAIVKPAARKRRERRAVRMRERDGGSEGGVEGFGEELSGW